MITEEAFMDIVAFHRQGHSIRFIYHISDRSSCCHFFHDRDRPHGGDVSTSMSASEEMNLSISHIHVVCAPREDYLAIITAYLPEAEEWSDDFKKRTKP